MKKSNNYKKSKENLVLIKFMYAFAAVLLTISTYAQSGCTLSADNVNGESATGNGMGQSFTATCSGNLSQLKVLSNSAQNSVTITIYQGAGVTGTVLATVTGVTTHNALSFTDYSSIELSSANISLTIGNVYTFYMTKPVAQDVSFYHSGSNHYAGGVAYYEGSANSDFDFIFVLDIAAASNTAPTVTTQAVSIISATTATGNGNITDLGSPNPTQYGVVWSTSTNPTVALPTKTEQGSTSSTGAFTSSITGLFSNTTYYVKAYATNSVGTSYGSEVSFTTSIATAGNALDFDGSDDYVNISGLNTNGFTGLTIEAWVNARTFNPQSPDNYISSLVGNETSLLRIGDDDPAELQANNKVQFVISTSAGSKKCSGTSDLTQNTWYHIVGTYDGSDMSLYVNGILENTVSHSGNIASAAGQKIGGAYVGGANTRLLDGYIDEVRIWNVARTEQEIRENMCQTLEGNETGLVAYYRMNESSGTSLPDISANNNTGTLTNMSDGDWVSSTAFNTWLDVASTSWTTPANWSRGSAPSATDNVGIPNYGSSQPTLTSALDCNMLVVGEGAALTFDYADTHTIHGSAFVIGTSDINSGNFLDITRSLYILPISRLEVKTGGQLTVGNKLDVLSTGQLNLKSTSSVTGSLIVDGASTGNVTMERYFPGASLQNWHMVAGPMTNMAISGSGFDPGDDDDFYAWNEPSPGTWVNYKVTTGDLTFAGVNGGDNFAPGKGYLVAYNLENPTKTFTGTLNSGNQPFILKNSGSKDWTYTTGWNLLGNPYSSSIDWNLATRNQFQDEFAYVYDPNKGGGEGFVNINGASSPAYIAPNQGFFVIAKPESHNQTFTFTNAIQAHGGAYMKADTDEQKMVLRLSDEQYYDEIQLRLSTQSTYNRDREDAIKMYSFNPVVPQLLSYSADLIPLAVNTIPQAGTEKSISLGIRAPKAGAYTLSISEMNQPFSSNGIYLEDLLLNSWHKLSESVYSFTSQEGDISDRFVIHFGVVGIEQPTSTNDIIQLWTADHTICLLNSTNLEGKVSVVNMYGQKVFEAPLNRNVNQQINLMAPAGYYIVNIVTKNGVVNKKVYLK